MTTFYSWTSRAHYASLSFIINLNTMMFAEGIAVRFEVRKNVMPVRSKECKADPIPPGCESTQAE